MAEKAEKKTYLPVVMPDRAALFARYRDAKKRAADAEVEAKELRDEIVHLAWTDSTAGLLAAAGLDGLQLGAAEGEAQLQITYTRSRRFQTDAFRHAHPYLAEQYTKLSAPEPKVTIL